MNAFGFSGFLTGISSLGFGLFVLFKSRDRKIAKIWFVFALSIAGWGFGTLWLSSAKSAYEAFLAAKISFAFGGICIPVLFYQFVCTFLNIDRRKSIRMHYAIGTVFLLSLPSHLLLKKVDFLWSSIYFAREGNGLWLLFIWWMSLIVYSHYLLLRVFRTAPPSTQNRIKYVFCAMLVGFGGGSLEWLPFFGMDIYPGGNFTVFLYPLIMSYAIVKHQLLDINFIIRKTLVYSVVTALLTVLYVLITIGLTHIMSGWAASSTMLSSGAATCVIALLFHPMRLKVQRFVDRHFFREALDQALLREATSGFVHEIKRPLTNISLPAELSLMDLQDLQDGHQSSADVLPKIKERLQYILHQTADAGGKIEAIREISDSSVTYSEDLSLSEIIGKSVSAERSLLDRHHIHLKLNIANDLPAIRGNEKQLTIVFSNLIKNAAEALGTMDSGSERSILISAHQSGDRITIRVEDSGPGIEPENRKHLFEPYFTTKGAHGTGIGLYLCRQIVQAHGGTIETRFEKSVGAEFVVSLRIDL